MERKQPVKPLIYQTCICILYWSTKQWSGSDIKCFLQKWSTKLPHFQPCCLDLEKKSLVSFSVILLLVCKLLVWILCAVKLKMKQVSSLSDGFLRRSGPRVVPMALPRGFFACLSPTCGSLNSISSLVLFFCQSRFRNFCSRKFATV